MENVCFMGNQNHKGVFFSHLLLPNSGGILGFSGGSLDMRKYSFAFFSNYRLCVECSSLARSALHSSYMRHSTAQLAIKSQKRNSILANFYFRKSENCPMHSDPTKLICVTPSEWIRWYRRYDNLKHSLFECVREKMLTL